MQTALFLLRGHNIPVTLWEPFEFETGRARASAQPGTKAEMQTKNKSPNLLVHYHARAILFQKSPRNCGPRDLGKVRVKVRGSGDVNQEKVVWVLECGQERGKSAAGCLIVH